MPRQLSMNPLERFLFHVPERPVNGCWLWAGRIESNGYGSFRYPGMPRLAHRSAHVLFIGPVPQDRPTIDHLCRVRSCVNPTHLEAVTQRTNVLRGVGLSAQAAARSHCNRGHLLLSETYIAGRGRECKECHAIRNQKREREYGHRIGRTEPRECLQCGKVFQAEITNLNRGRARFCSRSCVGQRNGQLLRGVKRRRQ